MPITCVAPAARIALRVAAGAERAVEIDAAVADVELFERGAREHGNVTGRSASDALPPLPAVIPVLRADLPPLSRNPDSSRLRARRSGPSRRAPNRPDSQICNLRKPAAAIGKRKRFSMARRESSPCSSWSRSGACGAAPNRRPSAHFLDASTA